MQKKDTVSEQKSSSPRFEFGENWYDFITKNLSEERVEILKSHLLKFLEKDNLDGITFLDIGCGQGLSLAAAFKAGAKSVHGFDYDPKSVAASQYVYEKIGSPENCLIKQGDVLNDAFMKKLGQFDVVHSWGVLHHTGKVWEALENSLQCVKMGGLLYVALYSADIVKPSPEFWLRIKQKYNKSSPFMKRCMEAWYIWVFMMKPLPRWHRVSRLYKQFRDYKASRGMSAMTNIRDWLGGWPMEFVWDQEAIDFLKARGFKLEKIVTGEANTEFLFRKISEELPAGT